MDLLKPFAFTAWLASILWLPACSSHIPPEIKQPIQNSPSITQAGKDANAYIKQKVRWGGTILETENKQDSSWLSIVAFQLNGEGRPSQSGTSPGRFIAIVDDFLEPLVFNADRQITVMGVLQGIESRKVGEFQYDYPLIKVEHYYLWSPISKTDYEYPPYWWHDPWYNHYPSHPYYIRRH